MEANPLNQIVGLSEAFLTPEPFAFLPASQSMRWLSAAATETAQKLEFEFGAEQLEAARVLAVVRAIRGLNNVGAETINQTILDTPSGRKFTCGSRQSEATAM